MNHERSAGEAIGMAWISKRDAPARRGERREGGEGRGGTTRPRAWARPGRFAAALTLLLLFAPASAPAQEGRPEFDAAVLRPGDMLRVSVWRRDELSGDFRVTSEGTLHHPLYRSVEVAEVPMETVEARLLDYLSRLETEPQLALQPFFRVIVAGEVGSPGVFDLPLETTVGEAVIRAGGPTDAARDVVHLVRDGREIELELRGSDGGAASTNIRSGDRIVLERKSGFNFLQHVFLPVMTTASTVVGIIQLAR